MSAAIDLPSYVVYKQNGNVDINATIRKFKDDVHEFQEQEQEQLEATKEAIESVFDSHETGRIKKPELVALVMQELSAGPDHYNRVKDQVSKVLKSDPDYQVSSGKSGGVTRITS